MKSERTITTRVRTHARETISTEIEMMKLNASINNARDRSIILLDAAEQITGVKYLAPWCFSACCFGFLAIISLVSRVSPLPCVAITFVRI